MSYTIFSIFLLFSTYELWKIELPQQKIYYLGIQSISATSDRKGLNFIEGPEKRAPTDQS